MPSDEHAVITHLPLSDDEYGTQDERDAIFELDKRYGAADDPGAREERVPLA